MKGQKGGIPETDLPDDHNVVVLGHELGNVLNGLLGMAELLGDSGLSPEQDRWLRAIEQSGRQMQSLIHSVHVFQGGNEPNIVPQRCRVDGMEMLEQVVISHTPAAHSRKIRLLLVTEPGLPRHWKCDSCLIRQLLDNLVGNAIKFTCAGEVVIEVASTPVAGTASEMLEFRISDTGPGLDEAAGKRIFAAYQGSSPAHRGKTADRGLGLFICRNIVLALNGRITCTSPKSGGARFEIALPETLVFSETCPGKLQSSLLEQIRCQLELAYPLRRSVENFLARLGVSCSNRLSVNSHATEQCLALVISDAQSTRQDQPPGLVLTPQANAGTVLRRRVLDAPVLESSLGVLLLEMALQWRSQEIRNGKRGSVPTRR